MRTLLTLLLLAATVLAQDTEKEDTLDELMRKWVHQLHDKDAKKRAEAKAELEKLGAHALRFLLEVHLETKDDSFTLEGGLPSHEARAVRVFVGRPEGGESMSGSWEHKGEKGTYDLKSLGQGRYKLKATVKGAQEGEDRKIEDEGTLRELQKKYTFLETTVMIGLPRRGVLLDTNAFFGPAKSRIGLLVRPPSPDLRHHLALPANAGMIVERVDKDSRAEKLGLRRYDVILKIGGELVEKPDQLVALEREGVEVEYVRRTQTKRMKTAAAKK